MHNFKTIRLSLATLALFFALELALPAEVSAQCPMCRKNVEASMDNPDTGKGFGLNAGILYLLALPYAMTGLVFYIWRRHNKRAQLELAYKKLGEDNPFAHDDDDA